KRNGFTASPNLAGKGAASSSCASVRPTWPHWRWPTSVSSGSSLFDNCDIACCSAGAFLSATWTITRLRRGTNETAPRPRMSLLTTVERDTFTSFGASRDAPEPKIRLKNRPTPAGMRTPRQPAPESASSATRTSKSDRQERIFMAIVPWSDASWALMSQANRLIEVPLRPGIILLREVDQAALVQRGRVLRFREQHGVKVGEGAVEVSGANTKAA